MKTNIISDDLPLIQSKRIVPRFLIAVALVCVGLSPVALAVVPAPDGGYPGGNTAEGQNALFSLTTGGFNTAVGFLSLTSNTEGQFNTAIGAGALLANTADQSTATGAGALLSNTSGQFNTANGAFALFSNTSGSNNTANGVNALLSNANGGTNTATGVDSLRNNIGGFANTASGGSALYSNTEGFNNTANGGGTLVNNTTGRGNTANGVSALVNNTTGNYNTALGHRAGASVTAASNVICIGADVAGQNVDYGCYIGNIFGQLAFGGTAVFVNSDGKLGTTTSSRRFKDEIKPMDQASEAILTLKPVTFRYKKAIDPHGILQFGLVAEDVEKVNPDLVVRDAEGKVNTVRYDAVNAMLLNEFLKEHKKVEEQQATIAELKSTVAQQQESFAEQRAQIQALASGLQKVSAQIEVSKSTSTVVVNTP